MRTASTFQPWPPHQASGSARTATLSPPGARGIYQGALTEVTARLGNGQQVRAFVTEPAPLPLAAGQTVHLSLPADAFMVLA